MDILANYFVNVIDKALNKEQIQLIKWMREYEYHTNREPEAINGPYENNVIKLRG